MKIRRYHESDKGSVVALNQHAMESAGGYLPGSWDSDFDSINEIYLNGRGEFLVGEIAGAVVAMGALLPVDAETAEVKRIRVDPARQGQGLGQMMLATLEERAEVLGYRHLQLDTLEIQSSAVKLFRRNGYLETGTGLFEGRKQLLFRKELKRRGIG